MQPVKRLVIDAAVPGSILGTHNRIINITCHGAFDIQKARYRRLRHQIIYQRQINIGAIKGKINALPQNHAAFQPETAIARQLAAEIIHRYLIALLCYGTCQVADHQPLIAEAAVPEAAKQLDAFHVMSIPGKRYIAGDAA